MKWISFARLIRKSADPLSIKATLNGLDLPSVQKGTQFVLQKPEQTCATADDKPIAQKYLLLTGA